MIITNEWLISLGWRVYGNPMIGWERGRLYYKPGEKYFGSLDSLASVEKVYTQKQLLKLTALYANDII